MSKADELRARAARAGQRKPSPPTDSTPDGETADVPSAPSGPRSVVRSTPVRITADLPPQDYRALVDFAGQLASQLGRARVPHVAIVRSLVVMLAQDEELQARVAAHVARQLNE